MKHQFNVNGVVNLILIPENDLEKSLLQSLSTQANDFKEVSKSSSVGAQYSDGTVIITGSHASKAKEV
jgi:hypothetical protein